MKAGVIGLGAMGAGMAANLAREGLLAAVWNRTYERAVDFAGRHGVAAAADAPTVAAQCDVILTCVSADADVLEVVEAMRPELGEGKVVVDTSTISADTAREAARRVAETGARFLDAPVSGGKEGAEQGTMVMMVGGDESTLERIRPVLSAISRSATHMGPSGAGQVTKAVNQIMVAGIIQGVTEGLAFGQAQGLDMDKVIEVLSGGAGGSWLLQHRGPTLVRGRYEPGFKMALHYKDLEICRSMLENMGVALPVVEMTLKQYRPLIEQGYGEEDISALHRGKRAMFENGGNKRGL